MVIMIPQQMENKVTSAKKIHTAWNLDKRTVGPIYFIIRIYQNSSTQSNLALW